MITVLLADDHTLVRTGYRLMLNAQPGITVVGEAADGLEAVAPRLLLGLIRTHVRGAPSQAPARIRGRTPLDGLTARELEVLTLIGGGRSNAEIADALAISPNTVKNHVTALFAKIGARDQAQAVIVAYERGLVRPGE
ncbi:response regulator transcription factor [Streptosporangium sp. NPDC049376]|uniref:response regulator transcription factor n=1 Tax=Streptosporangium sp. NPDC049376 TaxID=3366192 RepID=UPI0037B7A1EA